MMIATPHKNTQSLVDRLSVALAGTHGRDVTLESLRSISLLEIADWKHDCTTASKKEWYSAPLIAGPLRVSPRQN